jgi:Rrf2 family protein
MVRTGSTMQLTRAADYAVRVMIHMASLPANERALLPQLARATGAPESFLSKVLQALCRAGLIDSRRGQYGGFEIRDCGRRASMREVIEAIDGPIYINLCLMSGASCDRKSYCPAHPYWNKAQEAMLDVLNGAIIAELAAQVSADSPRGKALSSPLANHNGSDRTAADSHSRSGGKSKQHQPA